MIRKTLKEVGIKDCWETLRKTLLIQQRVTTSMNRPDGRTSHIRKSTRAEPALARIYQALGIHSAPGEPGNSSFNRKSRSVSQIGRTKVPREQVASGKRVACTGVQEK